MSRTKSLPWPSARAFGAITLLAAFVSPGATLAALGLLLGGKRVRAWNRLCSLAQSHPQYYRQWSKHFAKLRKCDLGAHDVHAPTLAFWELVEGKSEPLHTVLGTLEREGLQWIVFHAAEDIIDPDLAVVLDGTLKRAPGTSLIYWDEEWALPDGGLKPWIKPDWSERLHLARDLLTGACAICIVDALAAIEGSEPLQTDRIGLAKLAFAMQAAGRQPCHVPLILTCRTVPDLVQTEWTKIVQILKPHWVIESRNDGIPFLRVKPPAPPRWPSVSVIIPTRDGLRLLDACLEGLARTDYPGQIEILVIDNGSSDPDCLAYLSSLEASSKATVLREAGPFNFSFINNRAVAHASGEFLCLLNNDVEAFNHDWLCGMVRHVLQPEVGAVGAQLLYPDGSIQHAGVAIGLGNAAGHVQRGIGPDSTDHAAWHAVTREVSAVTAACLLVSRENYQAVGGLDEVGFAVAFNDVDFCLKLQAVGLLNVYCAESRLLHAESCTRPNDARPDQKARFIRELDLLQSRWQTETCQDPHYSPLFSRSSEACLLLPV